MEFSGWWDPPKTGKPRSCYRIYLKQLALDPGVLRTEARQFLARREDPKDTTRDSVYDMLYIICMLEQRAVTAPIRVIGSLANLRYTSGESAGALYGRQCLDQMDAGEC